MGSYLEVHQRREQRLGGIQQQAWPGLFQAPDPGGLCFQAGLSLADVTGRRVHGRLVLSHAENLAWGLGVAHQATAPP